MNRPYLAPAVVFGLTLASYVATLCPGVYTEGSGELIGATYLLGTPHPTGYPLFVLIGRVLAVLLPLGPPALAINLATALVAAGGAAALTLLLASRGIGRIGSLVAGLTLGWGQVYWSQAVISEVYGLFVAVTMLALTAVLAAADQPTTRRLLLAGYLCGLAVTTHLQAVLAMPVAILLVLWSVFQLRPAPVSESGGHRRWLDDMRRWPAAAITAWPQLAALVAGGILGLSVLLYLPLRSGRGAGFHWGDVSQPSELWAHLTAADYGASFFALSPMAMLHNARHFIDLTWQDWTPFGWSLALLGVIGLWQTDRRLLLTTLAAIALNVLAAMNYQRDPAGLDVFFLLALAGGALLIGGGAEALVRRRPVSAVIVLLLPLWLVTGHWQVVDRSQVTLPGQYGTDLLESLPPDAVLLTEGDDVAFLIDYLQRLEGVRPDVKIYNRQGRGHDLGDPAAGGIADRIRSRRAEEIRLWQNHRSLFITHLPARPLADGVRYEPYGLVYRVTDGRTAQSDLQPHGQSRGVAGTVTLEANRPRFNPQQRLAAAGLTAPIIDPWLSRLAANYWWMAGEADRDMGRKQAALGAYLAAAQIAPRSRSTLYNVSVRLMQEGQPEASYQVLEGVLQLDPTWPDAYRLASELLMRLGRDAELARLYDRARVWGVFP